MNAKKFRMFVTFLSVGCVVGYLCLMTGCEKKPPEDEEAMVKEMEKEALTAPAFTQSTAQKKASSSSNAAELAARKPMISVTGGVSMDTYHTTSTHGSGRASPYQYRVELVVTNVGTAPLVFDTVKGNFAPYGLEGLTMVTRPVSVAETVQLPSGKYIKAFVMNPGETEDFIFETNGYTDVLLADFRGMALMIAVAFICDGELVGKIYRAELPDIGELPKYALTLAEPEKYSAARLDFR